MMVVVNLPKKSSFCSVVDLKETTENGVELSLRVFQETTTKTAFDEHKGKPSGGLGHL